MTEAARPLSVRAAAQNDYRWVAVRLSENRNAAPLDVRPPVTAEMVQSGQLPCVTEDGRAARELVRFIVIDNARGLPLGCAISYGWDRADDTIRELDLTLTAGLPATVVLEAIVRLVHHGFRDGAVELRARTRAVGFTRLFASFGAKEMARVSQRDAVTGERSGRLLYAVQPAAFYASRAARRLGLSAPGSSAVVAASASTSGR